MLIDVNNPANIKNFLATCSKQPGIYKMLDESSEILYVGKAKNLAKRLASYFNKSNQSPKVAALVSQIHSISTIVTNTEAEALILECNLIKQHRPKYNILLRDDKSYPYICLSKHDFARIYIYRGKKPRDAICFGPYPNVYAAKQTVRLLQQVFLLRTCTDNYFNNRVRPCLLYQINRCSAPCVKQISTQQYAVTVKDAELFLEGRSNELIKKFVHSMELASEALDFEQAALIRDQIQKLTDVASQQYVEDSSKNNQKPIDVIGINTSGGLISVVILKFRNGRLIGSNEYLIKAPLWFKEQDSNADTEEAILSVLSQYYLDFAESIPSEIVINQKLVESSKSLLLELVNNKLNSTVQLLYKPRGAKSKWLNLAVKNAEELLAKKQKHNEVYTKKFSVLTKALSFKDDINSIECFDVSHTFGKQTIASCVVFNRSGPDKQNYRRYNIDKNINGDDVAALTEALTRRYKKLLNNNQLDMFPDLILIDGGRAQVNAAKKVFLGLGIQNQEIYGITKGEGRRAINDRIISGIDLEDVNLPAKSIAKELLQHIRDEAHRFAIIGHRAKREKEQLHSVLEDIPGVGPKRKKSLLTYLGGMQQIKQASLEQIAKVPGISQEMAKEIYNFLHK